MDNPFLIPMLLLVWFVIGEWPVIWMMKNEGRIRKIRTYILLILAWPATLILVARHLTKKKTKEKPKFREDYFNF